MRNILLFTVTAAALFAQDHPIVLKTATLYDGKGKTIHNSIVVVEGSKIAHIGGTPPANAITYDLTALTITPGWIDTHSHLAYHFDNNDRYGDRNEPLAQANWHVAENAVSTLEAGFTTDSESGRPARQGPAGFHSPRTFTRAAHPYVSATDHQSIVGRGEDARHRSRAQGAGSGFYQAVRLQEYSRRRRNHAHSRSRLMRFAARRNRSAFGQSFMHIPPSPPKQ